MTRSRSKYSDDKMWRAVKMASKQHSLPVKKIMDRTDSRSEIVDARLTVFMEARDNGVVISEIAKFFRMAEKTITYHLRRSEMGYVAPPVAFATGPSPARPSKPQLPPEDERTRLQQMQWLAWEESKAMRNRKSKVRMS